METEGLLSHLQFPAICHHQQPDQISPFIPQPTSWTSILILCLLDRASSW